MDFDYFHDFLSEFFAHIVVSKYATCSLKIDNLIRLFYTLLGHGIPVGISS